MLATLVLIDQGRLRQFTVLGRARRLFAAKSRVTWTDSDGVGWVGTRVGGLGFGVSALGPGWVFDPTIRALRAERVAERRQRLAGGEAAGRALAEAVAALRLGGRCERVLWSIHARLLRARRSVYQMSDIGLACDVYGANEAKWSAHWRSDLLATLRGLTWLHAAEWSRDAPPAFGANTALLNLAADLRGESGVVCGDDCPDRGGRPHAHFQVNVGRGFLGVLEQLAVAEDRNGVRSYDFSGARTPRGVSLRSVGKTGSLVRAFLPAKLGAAKARTALAPRQHDLLQTVVRELTRASGNKRRGPVPAEAEVTEGNFVPSANGRRRLPCPLLAAGRRVGFNGNGVRRGLGYTVGVWMARAGYCPADAARFAEDLSALASQLGLTVVGLQPGATPPWVGTDDLRALAGTPGGRAALRRLHLRLYAEEGWEERWAKFFWGDADSSPRDERRGLIARLRLLPGSRRQLAAEIGLDPSFFSKVLNGKKPLPAAAAARAEQLLAKRTNGSTVTQAGDADPLRHLWEGEPSPCPPPDVAAEAVRLAEAGWSVVPVLPGAKRPCVRWKPYRQTRPTPEQLREWFARWPRAGLAVVLGPVSGLFVIDVDGPEAHRVLLDRLGTVPQAPLAVSGSREPFRYHLYFRCPNVPTRAKATPWHSKLEFRGDGGLAVVPPSPHRSGRRYAWAPGRSPGELSLLEVPSAVLAALAAATRRRGVVVAQPVTSMPSPGWPVGADLSVSTREFLEGKHADGPRWNDRLFRAACDLSARGVPLEGAEPALLAGARPWDEQQAEAARRTIASAYGSAREPSRR